MENSFFTINHVDQSFYKQAHQTSAKYPKNQSEFLRVGLSEEYISDFYAPFVKEAKVKIAMKLVEHHHIKANGTEIVIGEVLFIQCESDLIQEDGSLNYQKLGTVALSGLDTYYETEIIEKRPYANKPAPGEKVRLIK